MKPITWTDDYSVGNKVLDEQHGQLITILNYLIRLSETSDLSMHHKSVLIALSMLTKYAQGHFKEEESIFSKTDYPKIGEHKKQHAEFEDYIAAFTQSMNNEAEHKIEELLTYVASWLNNHILIEDMGFKPYLTGSHQKNT